MGRDTRLLDAAIDEIDSGTTEIILEQRKKVSEAGAQLEQPPSTVRGVSAHERGVVAAREPVHAPSTPTAIGVVERVEVLVVEQLMRSIGDRNVVPR